MHQNHKRTMGDYNQKSRQRSVCSLPSGDSQLPSTVQAHSSPHHLHEGIFHWGGRSRNSSNSQTHLPVPAFYPKTPKRHWRGHAGFSTTQLSLCRVRAALDLGRELTVLRTLQPNTAAGSARVGSPASERLMFQHLLVLSQRHGEPHLTYL